jgi:Arc/MetJ-type ribon-helix-helix transcriptional regulator
VPAEKRLKVVGASQGQRTGTDGPSSSMNGPGANTSASWSGRSDTTAAYDPNRVYVRGRSATEMMSLRVPRPHQRFIEVFVAQRQHQDIETVSDFIRDAIHHRIEHWSHVIPDLDIDGLSLAAIVDEAQALAAEFELQKQVAPMWGQV